jgi:hypothetical protein
MSKKSLDITARDPEVYSSNSRSRARQPRTKMNSSQVAKYVGIERLDDMQGWAGDEQQENGRERSGYI